MNDSDKAPIPQPEDGNAPPQYTAVENGRQPTNSFLPDSSNELDSAFSSLRLDPWTAEVTSDMCLAHLKLLSVFQNLKDDIGYTDGLWQIFDTRVLSQEESSAINGEKGLKLEDETARRLSTLREKRWALYVARAVDRYESWWNTFPADPLTETDMESSSPKYSDFPNSNTPLAWTHFMLPPIDVLLVWHAHMLNPRSYLEDCMRSGLNALWVAGMPWKLVNDAINTGFNYTVSTECMATWENLTGRAWNNVDDSPIKTVTCPACQQKHQVPWTTCGLPEDSKGQDPSLLGEGYGDGNFTYVCSCGSTLTREFLEAAKFVKDVQALLAHGRPMPGTILGNRSGLPDRIPELPILRSRFERTFPNRLIKMHLRSALLELIVPNGGPTPSMESVRQLVEEALLDSSTVKKVEGVSGRDALRPYRLGREARVHTRKVMSRYWGNCSPFALDLSGAVLRQGIFTEKMYKIDWLHSPAARDTMLRLNVKYSRFVRMMALNPNRVVVPTLDVDLAWHTHQLSPRSYFEEMYKQTRKFIDHDDKIDEDKLSDAFGWTSRAYQATYGEVYSQCTCWYCEAVRASHVSSVGKALGVSKNEKISESFHESGQAALCPPDNSAHISAHNSVRVEDVQRYRRQVHDWMHLQHKNRLDDNYKKAQKRAQKKGRELPDKDAYYHYYWGYPYMMYAPYAYPAYYCPIYYGDPGVAVAGSGNGSCAAGTCSGGAAAGACGGASAGGCGGPGGCGAPSGCGGSSGSACGGGGGGGCGGGGGGGGCGGGGGGGG